MDTEKDNIITTSSDDEDLMLPEGCGAEDPIFAESSDDAKKQTDEPAAPADDEDGEGDGAEDAPTTAQDPAKDVSSSDAADAPTTEQDAPTTAQENADKAPNMLKFRAKYNSQEQDVELNETDLPGIWQKAQNHDRMQNRYNEQQKLLNEVEQLARSLGYADAKEMAQKAAGAFRDAEVKSLMEAEGVSERVAKAVVEQEMAKRVPAQPAAQTKSIPERNPQTEVNELLQARPDLRGKQIPEEVLAAAVAGKNLLAAYTEYEARQTAAEQKRAQQEENIRKQNAANAAKAPVKGVASGGAPKNDGGEDAFLKGFNEDY